MEDSLLIGICDGVIDKKKDTYYYTNKIGGCPDLMPGVSLSHYQCTLCGGFLSHVVQIYCPLAVSPYHRTINVFACTAPQCHGKLESWKVLRSQYLESEMKESSACQSSDREPVSTTDWCDDADEWGIEEDLAIEQTPAKEDNLTASLEVSSRLQELCINSSECLKAAGAAIDIPRFQPFYISVVEEADLVGQSDLAHANRLLKDYEKREGVAVTEILTRCEGEGGKEAYEKAKAKHGDAVFSSFMKRIAQCPEQVLRYSWSGTSLFIMETPSNVYQMVPPCAHCGSPRVFEFQLMPALVSLLHSAQLSSELAVEFGTVLIYTCRDSCWTSGSSGPVEEFPFVQTDPDQKLFK